MTSRRVDADSRKAEPANRSRSTPGAFAIRPVGCGPVAKLQAIRRAVCNKQLSKADVAVFVVIVDRMNLDGEAWPSINTVSKDAAVDRSTATRAVARLVKYLHLERISGSRTTSNRYRLGSCEPAPTRQVAPSCGEPPEVGASLPQTVGASLRHESVSLNLDNEPMRLDAIENLPGRKSPAFSRSEDEPPETEDEMYKRLHDERMHSLYAARCITEKG